MKHVCVFTEGNVFWKKIVTKVFFYSLFCHYMDVSISWESFFFDYKKPNFSLLLKTVYVSSLTGLPKSDASTGFFPCRFDFRKFRFQTRGNLLPCRINTSALEGEHMRRSFYGGHLAGPVSARGRGMKDGWLIVACSRNYVYISSPFVRIGHFGHFFTQKSCRSSRPSRKVAAQPDPLCIEQGTRRGGSFCVSRSSVAFKVSVSPRGMANTAKSDCSPSTSSELFFSVRYTHGYIQCVYKCGDEKNTEPCPSNREKTDSLDARPTHRGSG